MESGQKHFSLVGHFSFSIGVLVCFGSLCFPVSMLSADESCESTAVGQQETPDQTLEEIISAGVRESGIENFDPDGSSFSCRLDGNSHTCSADGDIQSFYSKDLFRSTYDNLLKNGIIEQSEKVENILVKPVVPKKAEEVLEDQDEAAPSESKSTSKFIYYFDSLSESVVQVNTETGEKRSAATPIGSNLGYTDFSADGESFVVYNKRTGEVDTQYRLGDLFESSNNQSQPTNSQSKSAPPTHLPDDKTSSPPPPFEVLLTNDLDIQAGNSNTDKKLPGFFVLNPRSGEVFYPEKLEAELNIHTKQPKSRSRVQNLNIQKNEFVVNTAAGRAYRFSEGKLQVYRLAKSLGSYFRNEAGSEILASVPELNMDDLGNPAQTGSLLLDSNSVSLADLSHAFEVAQSSDLQNADLNAFEDLRDSKLDPPSFDLRSQQFSQSLTAEEVRAEWVNEPLVSATTNNNKRDSIDRAFDEIRRDHQLQILIRRLKPFKQYDRSPSRMPNENIDSSVSPFNSKAPVQSSSSPLPAQPEKGEAQPQPSWMAVLNEEHLERLKRALQAI